MLPDNKSTIKSQHFNYALLCYSGMLTVLIFDGCMLIQFCAWTKHTLRQVICLTYYYLALSGTVFTWDKHISFCMLLSHLEINSIPSMSVKGKQTNDKIPVTLACNRGWIISWIFLKETLNTPLFLVMSVLVMCHLLGLPRNFIVNFWLRSLISQVEQNVLPLVSNDHKDKKKCF